MKPHTLEVVGKDGTVEVKRKRMRGKGSVVAVCACVCVSDRLLPDRLRQT